MWWMRSGAPRMGVSHALKGASAASGSLRGHARKEMPARSPTIKTKEVLGNVDPHPLDGTRGKEKVKEQVKEKEVPGGKTRRERGPEKFARST